MAFIPRRIGQKVFYTSAAATTDNFCSSVSWRFRFERLFAAASETEERSGENSVTRILKDRSVGVFWDLDNKPPRDVSPFKAATRLMEMAAGFGTVVDAVAYANHHAFSHVPNWVHEERRKRKMLDELEVQGLVMPEELYVCGVCGAKKKTRVELTKHFKSLHEREQKKRMNRLESLQGKKKKKQRFLDNNSEKMYKYKEAAKSLILPKVGYGLMQELRSAGLYVRTVEDKPQAADIALKEHMTKSMKKGVRCICLISDDSDFTPVLKMARERNLHTVVVGDLRILSAYADTYFSWAEVASGRAEQKARVETKQLMADFMSRLGSKLESHRYKGFGFDEGDESDHELGSDSEAEDTERWRPGDRILRPEGGADEGFHFFTDESSSESDSDDAGLFKYPVKPNFVARSAYGSKRISGRPRGFCTQRITEDTSMNDIISETDLRASLPKGSRGETCSTDDMRVRSLRAIAREQEGKASNNNSLPSRGATSVETNSSVDKIVQSFFDSSSGFEGRQGSESEKSISAKDAEIDAGSHPVGRGRRKKKKKIKEEEDQEKRAKSKKPKNHFQGRSGEPVPFYMSGFASESQEDCSRINRWYFGFWKNEEADEDYKVRRMLEKKKNKSIIERTGVSSSLDISSSLLQTTNQPTRPVCRASERERAMLRGSAHELLERALESRCWNGPRFWVRMLPYSGVSMITIWEGFTNGIALQGVGGVYNSAAVPFWKRLYVTCYVGDILGVGCSVRIVLLTPVEA
ncbi:hypothetical protein R1flu_019847 [Riccia fluitans]|uniref:C2H2-type domain-containing protein n=1 Tax=Riccia fluitans TaxID=41844 RepID=A0ABD1ZJU3_9MARC